MTSWSLEEDLPGCPLSFQIFSLNLPPGEQHNNTSTTETAATETAQDIMNVVIWFHTQTCCTICEILTLTFAHPSIGDKTSSSRTLNFWQLNERVTTLYIVYNKTTTQIHHNKTWPLTSKITSKWQQSKTHIFSCPSLSALLQVHHRQRLFFGCLGRLGRLLLRRRLGRFADWLRLCWGRWHWCGAIFGDARSGACHPLLYPAPNGMDNDGEKKKWKLMVILWLVPAFGIPDSGDSLSNKNQQPQVPNIRWEIERDMESLWNLQNKCACDGHDSQETLTWGYFMVVISISHPSLWSKLLYWYIYIYTISMTGKTWQFTLTKGCLFSSWYSRGL